jgi:two-component system nitrate/nitrite response regulator NarL
VLIARPPNAGGGALERSMNANFDLHTAAGEVEAIVDAFKEASADVVVVDLVCQGLDVKGLLIALRAARADARVVVVGDHLSDEDVVCAVMMDVSGLVVAPVCADSVTECVRQVLDGRLALDQRAMRRVIRSLAGRVTALEAAAGQLTQRELQIVRLVGAGLLNKEIAERLALKEGTIKVHLHNIFHKLQVSGRKALIEHARARGLC